MTVVHTSLCACKKGMNTAKSHFLSAIFPWGEGVIVFIGVASCWKFKKIIVKRF